MLPIGLANRRLFKALGRAFLVGTIGLVPFVTSPASAAPGDIVFVTQVPLQGDFANLVATFGNQNASLDVAPRGGDLYIRYSNGTLRNLTQAAGYGTNGFQGNSAIAVRDPAVHWDGEKILFSMVIGSPAQYQTTSYRWQLYEITGLRINETPVITKVPNQPDNYNNIMPTYASNDQIIFSSDRARNGQAHLFPQRDEYESTPTNTGLWRLNPENGELALLDHAPSGAFHPTVDSFGRILYTRWDHLQRDQQADGTDQYGGHNFSSEAANALSLNSKLEVFPEPRSEAQRVSATLNLHSFNHFFPWQLNQDGTGHETLNHIGRHELHNYFNASFNNDDNIDDFFHVSQRLNQNSIQNFFQIREDPLHPGTYFGIDCPEFGTHASGQIVSINGAPSVSANEMLVAYITARDTASTDSTPSADHSGMYRNPLPLSTGVLVSSHTSETREDRNEGTRASPQPRYQYRLKSITKQGAYWKTSQFLTSGISKNISYYDPDVLVTYTANLWELQPVELVARTRPSAQTSQLEAPEQAVFQQLGRDVGAFRQYLRENNLALIVSRNVTTRDKADKQQPFNLRVTGTNTKTLGAGGRIYDVNHLQLFQGDLIRAYSAFQGNLGRRVLAQTMHDALSLNPENPGGPAGSVKIASDGSVAALVPARRALSWQLTDAGGQGIVRERYWLTFQPGEIRVCASCHGVNATDQALQAAPTNPPLALRLLLEHLGSNPPSNPDPGSDPGQGLNPDPGTNPTPDPNIAQFSLAVSGRANKRGEFIEDQLFSKQTAVVTAIGENAAALNQALELRLIVNGSQCPAPIKQFVMPASGSRTFSGKLPQIKSALSLSFQLYSGGAMVAEKQATFFPKRDRGINQTLSSKQLRNLCARIAKLR